VAADKKGVGVFVRFCAPCVTETGRRRSVQERAERKPFVTQQAGGLSHSAHSIRPEWVPALGPRTAEVVERNQFPVCLRILELPRRWLSVNTNRAQNLTDIGVSLTAYRSLRTPRVGNSSRRNLSSNLLRRPWPTNAHPDTAGEH
jgi:hypothetical protein